ncbi:DEAD-box ATP-dependent RNA helicase 27-like protein, partial [Drosera capensis]
PDLRGGEARWLDRGSALIPNDVAASFCFTSPLKVDLLIQSSASKFRNKKRKVDGRCGFSESNPYGRSSDDTQHFPRG